MAMSTVQYRTAGGLPNCIFLSLPPYDLLRDVLVGRNVHYVQVVLVIRITRNHRTVWYTNNAKYILR